jgi:ribosomal-protein-serine acetyltransferase
MFRIETNIPNLYLTLADVKFADELFTLVDENRNYLRKWLPWLDRTTSAEDSVSFLRHCQAMYASQTQLSVLILLEDKLIGTTGFNDINHENHTGEIGYWLSEKHMGKGYMTESVNQVVSIGFEEFGLNRQVIRVEPDNKGSRNIATKLGFEHEGTAREAGYLYGNYRDLEIYSLLKSTWGKP